MKTEILTPETIFTLSITHTDNLICFEVDTNQVTTKFTFTSNVTEVVSRLYYYLLGITAITFQHKMAQVDFLNGLNELINEELINWNVHS